MHYRILGDSTLRVSELCLGTMTFGEQNSEAEAHAQLDLAHAHGINFVDTAEMYPVPAKADTQGRTEQYVGSWLKRMPRDQVILATKITGPARGMSWIREPEPQLDAASIRAAVEDSLRRLQTDYIDLYQIHWPARYVPMFGQTWYELEHERIAPSIESQLQALSALVQEGKLRYVGVSNETAWGVSAFSHAAAQFDLPRIVSIQNVYNLLLRTFEFGVAEACRHENVTLLAYSPLAFGLLSGKYAVDPACPGRMTRYPNFGARYLKPGVAEAAAAYRELALQHGLTPSQLALAFVRSRWFVGSTILGATSLAQLEENLSSRSVTLSPELLAAIEAVYRQHPNPAA